MKKRILASSLATKPSIALDFAHDLRAASFWTSSMYYEVSLSFRRGGNNGTFHQRAFAAAGGGSRSFYRRGSNAVPSRRPRSLKNPLVARLDILRYTLPIEAEAADEEGEEARASYHHTHPPNYGG